MSVTDTIRGDSHPERFWSTANIGEAAPDVMTPLCWSLWGPGNELAVRQTWCRFGLIDPDDVTVDPDQSNRLTGVFYGRQAMNIDLIRGFISRFPGISADDFELGLAGSVRPDAPKVQPVSAEHQAHIDTSTHDVSETHQARLADMVAEQRRWWLDDVLARTGRGDPAARLVEAFDRFVNAIGLHNETRLLSTALLSGVYELAAIAGQIEAVPAVFAAFGNVEELSMADDLWALAHGTLDEGTFIRRHGFHGESEGNPAGRSWREDASPLAAIAASLRDRSDDDHPARRAERATESQHVALAKLEAGLTVEQRDRLCDLLAESATSVREIETGKASFLMAIDGFRCAARDLGEQLVSDGRLDQRDDVFFLTLDEIRTDSGEPLREIVAFRRDRWSEYRNYIPRPAFIGMPEPLVADETRAGAGDVLQGIGASAGVYEGRVRVITRSDDDAQLDAGDVLVCASTDPSWTPIFMLVDAVVIDIGSVASHGAIVARELGIPAVINTGDGSRRLRDGDVVRVDGSAGTVTVVALAETS